MQIISPNETGTITDIARSASIRQALDGLLEGCMLLDFEWTYLYVNDAAARHGYQQRENLIGRSMLELYPGVEDSEPFRRYRITMEQRIPQKFEASYVFPDGTTNWYEFRVEPVPEGIFILSLDATEHRRMSAALEASARFSKNLVSSLQDGICILNDEGQIIATNPALCRMTGFSREELIGRTAPFPYWPPEEYPAIQDAFDRTVRGEMGPFDLTLMRKTGERFPVILSPSIIKDQDGNTLSYTSAIKNVTEQKRILKALESREAWFRAIFENTTTSISSTDTRGRLTSFNGAFCSLLGYDPETLRHMSFAELTHPDDLEHEMDLFNEIVTRKRSSYRITKRYIRRDGNVVWVDLSAAEVCDEAGQAFSIVAVLQDISDRKAAENAIEQLAFHDVLTRLPNRRLLQDRLTQALASSGRNGRHGALLFIDLDNFKGLNDTLGHYIGDLLLQQVAQRLAARIRSGDTVARLGGDEFVMMLDGLDADRIEAAAQTEALGTQLLTALNQPYRLESYDYHGSASIGATLFLGNQCAPEELMKQADIAMYHAKQCGRNTLQFFDQQMQKTVAVRVELEGELRKAIEKHQFRLHYQIQVDSSLNPIGAEALIRWAHPERGLVSPSEFIPLAEETGLIIPIGQWVLETACAQIQAWTRFPHTRQLVLAVNMSAKQFRQPGFVAQVESAVKRHGINPGLLRLELTEGMLLDDVDDTIATMNALNRIGLRFSLDDFGTGYSSLQYLRRLPLDRLKIDRSFVQDIASSRRDKAIIHTIISLAHNLDLEVIAEGVENEEQRQLLLGMGCNHFQGYLFSRPLPSARFEAWLTRMPTN